MNSIDYKLEKYKKKLDFYKKMSGGGYSDEDIKILSSELQIDEPSIKIAIDDIEKLGNLIFEYQNKPIIDRSFPREWKEYFEHGTARWTSIETSLPTQRTINASKILNLRGQSLLYMAGRFGSVEALKLILKIPGIDLDKKNTDGSTTAIGISFDRNIDIFVAIEKLQILKISGANLFIKKNEETVANNMCDKLKAHLGLNPIKGY
jgi:hypothetical protein